MYNFTDMNTVEGWKDVRKKCMDVKFRKSQYCIFEITCTDPVVLSHIINGGVNTSENLRNTPSKESLMETWNEFLEKIDSKKASLAVYDFGYYCKMGNYRSMIILISFVPECTDPRLKIAYSSNIHTIKEDMSVPANLHFDDLKELIFESVEESISRIQII